ncbi:hypothetical protein ACOMHN_049972 [Nucella lapillus]
MSSCLFTSLCSAKHHHKKRTEGHERRKRTEQEKEDEASPGAPLVGLPRYDHRNVLLHEAVRKLLGFESSPPTPQRREGGGGLLPDPRRPPPMPQYVLDLYEKYRSGEMTGGPALGNTVRSIPAEIAGTKSSAVSMISDNVPFLVRLLRTPPMLMLWLAVSAV